MPSERWTKFPHAVVDRYRLPMKLVIFDLRKKARKRSGQDHSVPDSDLLVGLFFELILNINVHISSTNDTLGTKKNIHGTTRDRCLILRRSRAVGVFFCHNLYCI